MAPFLCYNPLKEVLSMNKKSWYFILILSLLLIFIQFYKLGSVQGDYFDRILGLITGTGLSIAASIKIKNMKYH